MYSITKEFEFAYAHRVWAQYLDPAKSNNAKPRCRHIHGHNARVIVSLGSKTLQSHDVVLDYNELNFFKKFLDDVLDHKYIIDESDPLCPKVLMKVKNNYKEFDTSDESLSEYEREHLESYVIVPFIPTSENLAKWLFEYIKQYLGNMVISVTFSESQKTTATYVNEEFGK